MDMAQVDDSEWTVVAEQRVSTGLEDFLAALEVWIQKPQVVNKRVIGAVIHEHSQQQEQQGERNDDGEEGSLRCLSRTLLPRRKDAPTTTEAITIDETQGVATFSPTLAQESDAADPRPSPVVGGLQGYRVRYHQHHVMHPPLSISAEKPDVLSRNRITLSISQPPPSPYPSPSSPSPSLPSPPSPSPPPSPTPLDCWDRAYSNGVTAPRASWIVDTLLPKLAKWSDDNSDYSKKAGKGKGDQGSTRKKPPLVGLERYTKLYQTLKEQYGPPLIKAWPETTDPLKFVYEDIAIATYLLHKGKGLDLRSRKIWQLYGESTHLEVTALQPSNDTLFPDYDWVLGNHSDELTPWIPVMAARSSYSTNYFVLPCCPYDFDRKFNRVGSQRSQYRSYLDYVKLIGETMGFVVEEDSLRIPSNKRICHVGRKRWYQPESEQKVDEQRKLFLDRRCSRESNKAARNLSKTSSCTLDDSKEHSLLSDYTETCSRREESKLETDLESDTATTTERKHATVVTRTADLELELSDTTASGFGTNESALWASEFKPRSSVEPVRNCSSVSSCLSEFIVETLADVLLKQRGEDSLQQVPCCGFEREGDKLWNRGGTLHLSSAASLFDDTVLSQMKKECGGLQTLLRNHHQIFEVSGGCVRIRDWSSYDPPGHSSSSPSPSPSSPSPSSSSSDLKKKKKKKKKEPSHPHPHQGWRSKRDAKILVKTKLCWFHQRHPDGCPRRRPEDCPYAHGPGELRTRPNFRELHPR